MTDTYDEQGLFREDLFKHTMKTFTQSHIDPLDLDPADICIEDIAHSLSRQCRFNGHCPGFISVADHCLRVSNDLGEKFGTEMALWGLLHDAAEAYLGDMIRPMKLSGMFDAFLRAETRAEHAIAERFALEWPMPPEVKAADNRAVLWELHEGWERMTYPGEDEANYLSAYRVLSWNR